jgi:hypothetical protein
MNTLDMPRPATAVRDAEARRPTAAAPDPTDSDVAARKRRANDYMRDGLARYDTTEPIPFFCECDRERCFRPIWLAGGEYDERRPADGWRPLAAHDEADELPLARALAHGWA